MMPLDVQENKYLNSSSATESGMLHSTALLSPKAADKRNLIFFPKSDFPDFSQNLLKKLYRVVLENI